MTGRGDQLEVPFFYKSRGFATIEIEPLFDQACKTNFSPNSRPRSADVDKSSLYINIIATYSLCNYVCHAQSIDTWAE